MVIDQCKRRARQVSFWPGINKEIELSLKRRQEYSNSPSREPLIPITIPNLPWNQVEYRCFRVFKELLFNCS